MKNKKDNTVDKRSTILERPRGKKSKDYKPQGSRLIIGSNTMALTCSMRPEYLKLIDDLADHYERLGAPRPSRSTIVRIALEDLAWMHRHDVDGDNLLKILDYQNQRANNYKGDVK